MPLILLLLAVAVVCSLDEREPKKKRKHNGTKLEKPTGVGGNSSSPDLGIEQHTAGSGSVGAIEPVETTEPLTRVA